MTPDTLETVRGWLSTGLLGGNLFVLSRVIPKVVPPVLQYLQESRAMKLKERADERGGWGDLIDALRQEVTELRLENTSMRAEIRNLHSQIDGMTRGELQSRRSAQFVELAAMPEGSVPPATAAAVARELGEEGDL